MNLVVYLVGMFAFTSGFYFVKKSETVWNGVCSIFLSYMVWMLVQSLICEINVLLQYQVIAWQYGLLGLLTGGYWWFQIIRNKKRQSYRYEILDVFVVLLLLLFIFGWSRYQFGSHLQNFNYRSVTDSARHLHFARTLVEEGNTRTGMYFAAVNTAVWMSALEEYVSRFFQYKIYIVFDLGVLFLNGMIFWMAIHRFLKNTYLKIVGVLFTFLYVFGHPLNTLAYGTIYLSTGIMLTILIYYFSMLLIKKEINGDWGKGLLAFALIGLRYSYILFVPAFVFGPLVYLYYAGKIERKEITQRLIRNSWVLWGMLFLLGCIYLYLFYVTGDAVIFSDLNLRGLMYGHPYADYLFLFPFLLLLLWADGKTRQIGLEEFLFLLELGMVIVLALGTINGKISVYYFYKTYVSLWGVAFLSVMKYISGLRMEKREFVTTILVIWGIMFLLCVTDAEGHLYQKSERYGSLNTARACFPLYTANLSMPRELDSQKDLADLIMKSARLSCEKEILIPYISEEEGFDNRYYSLAGQDPEWKFKFLQMDNPQKTLNEEYQYVLVIWGDGITPAQVSGLNIEKVIVKNSAGYLAKIKR